MAQTGRNSIISPFRTKANSVHVHCQSMPICSSYLWYLYITVPLWHHFVLWYEYGWHQFKCRSMVTRSDLRLVHECTA